MNPIPLPVRAELAAQDYGGYIASVVALVLDHVHSAALVRCCPAPRHC